MYLGDLGVLAYLSLLVDQCLGPVLVHLLDAEPPEGVLEDVGARAVAPGLLELLAVHEGPAAANQGLVQPQPVLVGDLLDPPPRGVGLADPVGQGGAVGGDQLTDGRLLGGLKHVNL